MSSFLKETKKIIRQKWSMGEIVFPQFIPQKARSSLAVHASIQMDVTF